MKKFILCFTLCIMIVINHFTHTMFFVDATPVIPPPTLSLTASTINATYNVGDTPTDLDVDYHVEFAADGAYEYSPVYWYSNTSRSRDGSTKLTDAPTGIASGYGYTPDTSTAGVLYYYAEARTEVFDLDTDELIATSTWVYTDYIEITVNDTAIVTPSPSPTVTPSPSVSPSPSPSIGTTGPTVSTDPNLGPNADPDGDGIPNWREWQLGTDMFSTNSRETSSFNRIITVPTSLLTNKYFDIKQSGDADASSIVNDADRIVFEKLNDSHLNSLHNVAIRLYRELLTKFDVQSLSLMEILDIADIKAYKGSDLLKGVHQVTAKLVTPIELTSTQRLVVLHNDGSWKILESSLSNGDLLTFETDGFSPFALMKVDTEGKALLSPNTGS